MILPIGTLTVGLPLKNHSNCPSGTASFVIFLSYFVTCSLLKCATYVRRRNSGLFNQQVHT